MGSRAHTQDGEVPILEIIASALGDGAAELVSGILDDEALALFESSTSAWIWRGEGSEFYQALTRGGIVDFGVAASAVYGDPLPKLATLGELLSGSTESLSHLSALIDGAISGSAVDVDFLGGLSLADTHLLADFVGSIIGIAAFLHQRDDEQRWTVNQLKSGNDLRHGTESADGIDGGAGNDTLMGYGGNDWLDGRWGDDVAFGGAGNDRFNGFEGNDVAHGDEGDDWLDGHKGNDFLLGDAGDDFLQGGLGSDTLRGGAGDDKLVDPHGGVLVGGAGDDLLLGTSLNGGTGDDDLRGTASGDELIGGKGRDKLAGDAGSDRFIWESIAESKAGTAGDLVRDFEHGGDILDLSGIDAVRRTPVDDAFSFIGEDKFSDTAGELRIKIKKDGVTVLGDVNGDGRADFILIVRDEDSLEASDFLL